MLDYEFEARIKRGVEWNRMVYDEFSTHQVPLTKRLVYLMYGESGEKMTKLYVPTDAFPEWEWEKSYGPIEIVKDQRLNVDAVFDIINKHEMTMPSCIEDDYTMGSLVLGVWSNGSLLGAIP